MIANKINEPPFLIVGQGIAGTLLAYFFFQKKQSFIVIDKPLAGASSHVAAGIINPITGRRMVKSWRFDELSKFAKSTYLGMGKMLGVDLFQEKNILRALPTVFDENEWDRRSGFPENRSFFCESAHMGNYHGIVSPCRYGELRGASKVDFKHLLVSFKESLIKKKLFLDEFFDFGKIEMTSNAVFYEGNAYKKIIFCEGAKAIFNPYFNYLPFSPTKGELLLVKIKGLQASKILKNKIYIVPLGEDLYWVGSTNSFDYEGAMPTKEQKEYLEKTLSEILKVPFEIIAHRAGIRPTVADKRPFLGVHSKHRDIAIFNGLGTKGASLGPFFAKQMVEHLLGESKLDQEVDINRFKESQRLIS